MNEKPPDQPGVSQSELRFKALVINSVGSRKIAFIKVLRHITGLQLVDVKNISEKPAPFVMLACDEANAAELEKVFTAAGSSCQVVDYRDDMEPAIPNDHPLRLEGAGQTGCATSAMILLAVGAAAASAWVHLFT